MLLLFETWKFLLIFLSQVRNFYYFFLFFARITIFYRDFLRILCTYKRHSQQVIHTCIRHDILIFCYVFKIIHTHTLTLIFTFCCYCFIILKLSKQELSIQYTHSLTLTQVTSKKTYMFSSNMFWEKHKQICIRSLALSTWIINLPLDVSLRKELIRVSKFLSRRDLFFMLFNFFLLLFLLSLLASASLF